MITNTRRLQFCAGHRVYGHESKCANMHGHNYVVYLTARKQPPTISKELAEQGLIGYSDLDPIGRVVDFSVLKNRFDPWIQAHWDHGFLYWEKDDELAKLFRSHPTHKHRACTFNPTAENMADHLLRVVGPLLLRNMDVHLVKVVLYETENCSAEAVL